MLTTIIKKTITGVCQTTSGFIEPISRVMGIRVRTAANKALSLSHDDTAGTVESHDGPLKLRGVGGVEFPDGATLPAGVAIPADADMPADLIDAAALQSDAVETDKILNSAITDSKLSAQVSDKINRLVFATHHGIAGDGATDETAAIQTFFDTFSGGRLYFPAGTYLIYDTLYLTGDDTHILLHKDAVFKLASGRAVDQHMLKIRAERVLIDGGTFDGNQANNGGNYTSGIILDEVSNDFEIRNCTIRDFEKRGIETQNQTGVIPGLEYNRTYIHDCRFSGCAIAVILFAPMESDLSGVRIQNNHFEQAGRAGGDVDMLCGLRGGVGRGSVKNSIISDNVFILDPLVDNQPSFQIQCVEVSSDFSDTVTVCDNVCSGGDIGVSVVSHSTDAASGPANCIVSGNVISGCNQMGIEIQGHHNLITGNTLDGLNLTYSDKKAQGIAETSDKTPARHNKISNNIIRNYPDWGIIIGAKHIHTEVSDNSISNCMYAIRCYAGTAAEMTEFASITGNRIFADTFAGNTSAFGIYVVGGNAFNIDGNRIIDHYVGVNIYCSIDTTAGAGVYSGFSVNDNHFTGVTNRINVGGAYSAQVERFPAKGNSGLHSSRTINYHDFPGNVFEMWGSGTPAGNNISAGVGSVYWRTNGTTGQTMYVKESGTDSTGWVAK